jgi:hypothetical protein
VSAAGCSEICSHDSALERASAAKKQAVLDVDHKLKAARLASTAF